jgi:hypothetical protein
MSTRLCGGAWFLCKDHECGYWGDSVCEATTECSFAGRVYDMHSKNNGSIIGTVYSSMDCTLLNAQLDARY